MSPFPRTFRYLMLAVGMLLAACGVLPGLPAPMQDTQPTLTPLPTTTAPNFPTVEDRSCLLATLEPLRTDQNQGDLLAWMPDSHQLAFVGPALNSNWFAGALKLASGPDFKTITKLAPDTLVFGSLNWSPDGTILAYVAFRQSDGVYTAMTSPVDGSGPTDWLPGKLAQTDTGSSLKSIQSWQAGRQLRVISSCGDDCDQALDINTQSGVVSPYGEQTRRNAARWDAVLHQLVVDKENYPDVIITDYPLMKLPNWSWDGKKIAFVDEDDYVRVLLVDGKAQYILQTGLESAREYKWSSDSRLLAVRMDDFIYVFDTECKK